MNNKKKLILSHFALASAMGVGLLFMPASVLAMAGNCVNCHTMHNSQDNDPMTFDNTPTPNESLLRGVGCLGCHAHDAKTRDINGSSVPIVLNTAGPAGSSGPTDFPAGGGFYWVEIGLDDATGHNVAALTANPDDDTLGNRPPGRNADLSSHLTCAGTNGCHGNHTTTNEMGAIAGAHHGNNAAGTIAAGDTLGHSYRFLSGVMGIEDADWELTVTAAEHNQYRGSDRDGDDTNDAETISSLCAQCHPDFHNTTDAFNTANDGVGAAGGEASSLGSPWVRHPTDFDLNDATGSEYASYNKDVAVGTYSWIAPVGSTNAGDAGSTMVNNTVLTAGNGIVLCVSCHRAHGTAYPDILRWNYDGITVSGDGSGGGCKICHTTK